MFKFTQKAVATLAIALSAATFASNVAAIQVGANTAEDRSAWTIYGCSQHNHSENTLDGGYPQLI